MAGGEGQAACYRCGLPRGAPVPQAQAQAPAPPAAQQPAIAPLASDGGGPTELHTLLQELAVARGS